MPRERDLRAEPRLSGPGTASGRDSRARRDAHRRRAPRGGRAPARGGRDGRSGRTGPLRRVDRAVHRLRPVPGGRLPELGLQGQQRHELLAPVDRAQLHELRRLPPRQERPAQHQARHPVRQRLQLGSGLPEPDQRRPCRRARSPGGTPPSPRRDTSPTSRRWCRPTRSSCPRTTGVATSGGARSPGPEAGGPTASSTSGTRARRSSTPTSTAPLTPTRLLDTRTGLGAPAAKVAAGASRRPAGQRPSRRPERRASAPRCSTSRSPRPPTAGYLTSYPSGATRPGSRSVTYPAAGTISELVPARLGTDGKVRLYTSAAAHLVAEVVGWYPTTGHLVSVTPTRVLDTRTGLGTRPGARARERQRRPAGGRRRHRPEHGGVGRRPRRLGGRAQRAAAG